MSDIKKIKDEYFLKLKENLDLNQINQIKTDLFGKNGLVSSQFKQLGKIAEDERKIFASDLNTTKDELQDLISSKIDEIENKEINPIPCKLNIPKSQKKINCKKIKQIKMKQNEITSKTI